MMGDVPYVAGFAKPLWEGVRLGGDWGGVWAYHSAALLTGSGAGSVATFLQQMFDRENIFTAGKGREGKYMFYDTLQLRWRKRREKNPSVCRIFYCTPAYILSSGLSLGNPFGWPFTVSASIFPITPRVHVLVLIRGKVSVNHVGSSV